MIMTNLQHIVRIARTYKQSLFKETGGQVKLTKWANDG